MPAVNRLAMFFLGMYRTAGSLFFGGSCRFEPSCSAYAQEAFAKHGFFSALKLTCLRLIKCQPWGPFGFDPVPDKGNHL